MIGQTNNHTPHTQTEITILYIEMLGYSLLYIVQLFFQIHKPKIGLIESENERTDIKNGLNFVNPITNKSASLFLPNLFTPVRNFRSLKIVIFKSISLKFDSLNRKLYVDFKNGLNLENPITKRVFRVRPLFPVFLDTLYIFYMQ